MFAQFELPDTTVNLADAISTTILTVAGVVGVVMGGYFAFLLIRRGLRWARGAFDSEVGTEGSGFVDGWTYYGWYPSIHAAHAAGGQLVASGQYDRYKVDDDCDGIALLVPDLEF